MKKTIVYFTDSRLEEELDYAVRKQLLKAANGIPIISVTQKPVDFGKNICVGFKPRCYLSLYEQLLIGIKAAEDDSIIFTCEHDVFYNPAYFEFVPSHKQKIYFNKNRYYWKRNQEIFVFAHGNRALSQGVGYKAPFLKYAKEQVQKRKSGIMCLNQGSFSTFTSRYPNVDIRHGSNFSSSWVFRGFANDSAELKELEYWGNAKGLQDHTGYKNIDVEAQAVLHERFNPDGKENPVETEELRSDLPGLFNSFKFKRGAEIGVKRGVFSLCLCENIPDLELKCVDPYLPTPETDWDIAEGYFNSALEKLEMYAAQIIKKTSMHAAAEDVPKWSLDFVYIDADHSFNEVMQDIIIWSDRVRPGGIVSGHDYDAEDVRIAIDAYVKIHGYELFITKKGAKYPDSSPSWFFAKGTH